MLADLFAVAFQLIYIHWIKIWSEFLKWLLDITSRVAVPTIGRAIITINIFFWNIYSTNRAATGRTLANADPYFVIRKEFINPNPYE